MNNLALRKQISGYCSDVGQIWESFIERRLMREKRAADARPLGKPRH